MCAKIVDCLMCAIIVDSTVGAGGVDFADTGREARGFREGRGLPQARHRACRTSGIYMHIYTYLSIYLSTHICIHTYIYVYIYLQICIYVSMHTYKNTYICIYIYIYAYLYLKGVGTLGARLAVFEKAVAFPKRVIERAALQVNRERVLY